MKRSKNSKYNKKRMNILMDNKLNMKKVKKRIYKQINQNNKQIK